MRISGGKSTWFIDKKVYIKTVSRLQNCYFPQITWKSLQVTGVSIYCTTALSKSIEWRSSLRSLWRRERIIRISDDWRDQDWFYGHLIRIPRFMAKLLQKTRFYHPQRWSTSAPYSAPQKFFPIHHSLTLPSGAVFEESVRCTSRFENSWETFCFVTYYTAIEFLVLWEITSRMTYISRQQNSNDRRHLERTDTEKIKRTKLIWCTFRILLFVVHIFKRLLFRFFTLVVFKSIKLILNFYMAYKIKSYTSFSNSSFL